MSWKARGVYFLRSKTNINTSPTIEKMHKLILMSLIGKIEKKNYRLLVNPSGNYIISSASLYTRQAWGTV